jgi:hypothetical protein
MKQNEEITNQLRKMNNPYIKNVTVVTHKDGTYGVTVTEDTTVTVPFKSGSYMVEIEALNRKRGSDTGAIRSKVDTILRTAGSPSPFAKVIMSALLDIFDTKETGRQFLSKNKSANQTITKKKRISARGKAHNLNTKAKSTPLPSAPKRSKKTNRTISIVPEEESKDELLGVSLLATINQEIRQAVIDQMKAPALVYRTGRFANSVAINGVSEAKSSYIIEYTYRHSPYDVFSPSRSSSPLASFSRDPNTIIRNAIRSIITKKFGGVLEYALVGK